MSVLDPIGPAPETRTPRFLWLLFGFAAAPLAWLAQIMLAYGVTAYACYPGDHPIGPGLHSPLLIALTAFDMCALAICAAGAIVSWRGWLQVRAGDGRNRLLALWGLMSSLWFFGAILFNVIASVVPPCAG